jgi:hypothetical protein
MDKLIDFNLMQARKKPEPVRTATQNDFNNLPIFMDKQLKPIKNPQGSIKERASLTLSFIGGRRKEKRSNSILENFFTPPTQVNTQ